MWQVSDPVTNDAGVPPWGAGGGKFPGGRMSAVPTERSLVCRSENNWTEIDDVIGALPINGFSGQSMDCY
jgi:hypothetical protein